MLKIIHEHATKTKVEDKGIGQEKYKSEIRELAIANLKFGASIPWESEGSISLSPSVSASSTQQIAIIGS